MNLPTKVVRRPRGSIPESIAMAKANARLTNPLSSIQNTTVINAISEGSGVLIWLALVVVKSNGQGQSGPSELRER